MRKILSKTSYLFRIVHTIASVLLMLTSSFLLLSRALTQLKCHEAWSRPSAVSAVPRC